MDKLRIALLDNNGDEVASISGEKIQIKWEEYSHGDTDQESSDTYTITEILSLLRNRNKFYSEESRKAISEAERLRIEAYKKLDIVNKQKDKLSEEIAILKATIEIKNK